MALTLWMCMVSSVAWSQACCMTCKNRHAKTHVCQTLSKATADLVGGSLSCGSKLMAETETAQHSTSKHYMSAVYEARLA
jgi:hypothetical protein